MSGNTDYSPTEGGLPDAGDYDPEANRDVNITAGEPIQTYDDYGVAMLPVLHDGQDVGRRHIVRNGNFIASVSEQYKLLPNEHAVAAANDVAREIGLVPFHEWGDEDDDWYARLDDHVYQDKERRRVHALYAMPEPFYIGGDVGAGEKGEKVHVGAAIHNSIDASLSFQVGLFTFRQGFSSAAT